MVKEVNIRKVAVIGCGFVGSTSAYTLMQSSLFSEMVLIDADRARAEGEALDIKHGLPFAKPMNIYAGDYSDIVDAAIIVITAGAAQKPGETRLDLVKKNTAIMKSIIGEIKKQNCQGILLIVSNPVDVLTNVALKASGFPENRVIGSGTVLDTARLRYIMAEYLNVSSKNIHAYVMGEHGDSSFVPWNHAYVGCKKISDVMKDNNHPMDDLEKIHKDVVNAAYEIINKKKATYYGIGVALSRLVKAILEDEHGILTVSAYLKDGEYGQDDIYIGVPAIICSEGIREVVNLDLTDEEQAKLDESCKIIKEMRANSIEKIINE